MHQPAPPTAGETVTKCYYLNLNVPEHEFVIHEYNFQTNIFLNEVLHSVTEAESQGDRLVWMVGVQNNTTVTQETGVCIQSTDCG